MFIRIYCNSTWAQSPQGLPLITGEKISGTSPVPLAISEESCNH